MVDCSSDARYAVVGNPVAHSLSPRIHAQFAAETGKPVVYEAIELATDEFDAGVRRLQREGYRGLNVTVPFKREAWALSEHLSARAEDAGAVNTLILDRKDGIAGDNTDGIGLVRDLRDNLGIEIENRRLLLLGAGGAARGVIGPLLALSPRELVIANRTAHRAVDLVRDFAGRGPLIAIECDRLASERFDLIVNATAAGLGGSLPPLPEQVIDANTACYDMMYDLSAATAFVSWTLSRGACMAHDGLGMLVEQAAESFRLWQGVSPDTGAVLRMLRP